MMVTPNFERYEAFLEVVLPRSIFNIQKFVFLNRGNIVLTVTLNITFLLFSLGGDGNFNLPPLPSPPLQSQNDSHFHSQIPLHPAATTGQIPTPTHNQQLHVPSTPTQQQPQTQPLPQGVSPNHQHQKLHAPSPGDPGVQSPMGLPGQSPHHQAHHHSNKQPSLPMSVQTQLGIQPQQHQLGQQSAPSLSQFMAELSWQGGSGGGGPPQLPTTATQPPLPAQPMPSPQPQGGGPSTVAPPQSPQQQPQQGLQHQVGGGS